MNIAQQMMEVRKIRDEVDRHLSEIEGLCGTAESRELLVKSWYARTELKNQSVLLDQRIAELHDAEKKALAMKREEEQRDRVFDNGELCP